MNHYLSATVWTEVPEHPVVLVPLGSTEQHGPHLPFGTDTLIAERTASAVAGQLTVEGAGPVVVAPSLAYGASGEHQDFPGTVSIGHDALKVVLVEMIRSMSTWSRCIVLINGHGGNTATVQRVVEQMRYEQHNVLWTSCALESTTDAHAGHDETSVLLHLDPKLVNLGSAVVGNTQPLQEILADLIEQGVRPVSPSGVLGDPTNADARLGEQQFGLMVGRIVQEVKGA